MIHVQMSVNYSFHCVFVLKARMFYNGRWLAEVLCGGKRFSDSECTQSAQGRSSGLWRLPVVLFGIAAFFHFKHCVKTH